MIVLSRKHSKVMNKMNKISYDTLKRNKQVQIDTLTIKLRNGENYGFVYCRSKPTIAESKALCSHFYDCAVLLGDFNLSHRISDDQEKLSAICKPKKQNVLHEITRISSMNQLDYVLVNETYTNTALASTYFNFISDHNSIVVTKCHKK